MNAMFLFTLKIVPSMYPANGYQMRFLVSGYVTPEWRRRLTIKDGLELLSGKAGRHHSLKTPLRRMTPTP